MSLFKSLTNPARFNLSRWFAAVALVAISVLAVSLGALMDRFITQRLMWQEALLTRDFVQTLVRFERPLQAFLGDPSRGLNADSDAAFKQIAALPDMLRANVYDRDRRIIWSSDQPLVGKQFGPNGELDSALAGHVVTHAAHGDHAEAGKSEHLDLLRSKSGFIEIYVPIMSPSGDAVQAVIEFYKSPRALDAALKELRRYIALGAASSGLLLFAALFGLVWRADQTIRRQQSQLVDNETLAVIGEMSAAVAHGIRNPLAAIRSSAELIQDGDLALAQEAGSDIVAQSDRLEAWVRELLAYTRPIDKAVAPVPLQPLVARCLEDFERDMSRRHIIGHAELSLDLPAVRGDALLLGQVLSSLMANAIEALDREGHITVRGAWQPAKSIVVLSVQDNGPGMTSAQVRRVGKPFHTTKARGLGVGLALARRVIERFGGRLEIDSRPGRGTTVHLYMLAA